MNHTKNGNWHNHSCPILFVLVILLINVPCGFSQVINKNRKIYFISDTQEPMEAEKVFLKSYKNSQARDTLFADILRQRPDNLFTLGDMVSLGTDEKAWTPIDSFLISLHKLNSRVYAIPGNHEYMLISSAGMKKFAQRFPLSWQFGYCIKTDSIAFVMINSNFEKLSENELSRQLSWYRMTLDSLENDKGILSVVVCTHHCPFSNSKVVGSSNPVLDLIVPGFKKAAKTKLLISGHSHNLEYFADSSGKHYLVIGGGGGIAQPLLSGNDQKYHDLLKQEEKPLYFYFILERKGNQLLLVVRGFKQDFKMFEMNICETHLN